MSRSLLISCTTSGRCCWKSQQRMVSFSAACKTHAEVSSPGTSGWLCTCLSCCIPHPTLECSSVECVNTATVWGSVGGPGAGLCQGITKLEWSWDQDAWTGTENSECLFNSLAPGEFGWNFRYVIFKWILVIDGWNISCEIALIWMSLDFTDDQSALVQVMAWCRQATSHYLSQCWPRSLSLGHNEVTHHVHIN